MPATVARADSAWYVCCGNWSKDEPGRESVDPDALRTELGGERTVKVSTAALAVE